MPSIKSTLEKYDLDLLLRIARAWEVEISERDASSARIDLASKMVKNDLFDTLLKSLDESAHLVWQSLAGKGGRQTWAEFSRLNGEIRDLGPAARGRENPDLHPVSVSEILFYSGLIARAFFGGAREPVEFAFIPEELLAFREKSVNPELKKSVRPAVNQSPRHIVKADSAILDQLTDLLAAHRMQRTLPEAVFTTWGKPKSFLQSMLSSAGLINIDSQPNVETLKEYFSAERDHALQQLFAAWRTTTTLNELRMLPGLTCEGNWHNDPCLARELLIEMLFALEAGTWWSISSLLATVKEVNPDFQRPAGDYDSWFIRDDKTGAYLSGFYSWERVEGALLVYLLTGPLHWLGIVNLARANAEGKFTAFQLSPNAHDLLNDALRSLGGHENKTIRVKDARTLLVPVGTPLMLRYQVGRVGVLINATEKESRYLLTIDSLEKAAEQGLQLQQLLQLLEKEQPGVVTDGLKRLVERWAKRGNEAGFEHAILLRFKSETACDELINAAGNRFSLERLNPQTLSISKAQQEGIIRLLAELGILVVDAADV